MNSPYTRNDSIYDSLFTDTYLPVEEYATFDLTMTDAQLQKMFINDLNENIAWWNQKPWNLEDADKANIDYLLGDQMQTIDGFTKEDKDPDNRMFSSMRAMLSYATGQLARPEVTPSRGDDIYLKSAHDVQAAAYQHAMDNDVEEKTRAAALNLIARKRGFMKLRWDPNAGVDGDIVTEVCNPEDIIIGRYSKFLDNPHVIYHRLRASIDELCMRFPDKETDIKAAFSIKKGVYTQMSKYVTYFEAWFTYIDNGVPKEGVCWFLDTPALILDKEPNPNWLYKGNIKKEKELNLLSCPPKPFVYFNYINTGHYFIDETSLFDQMRPIQARLNKRLVQFDKNIDYMNGRWIASKGALSEEDAYKMVNKGSKTVTLVDTTQVGDNVNNAVKVETPNQLPAQVYQSILDSRTEIDQMGGTPSIFRGSQPDGHDTATRDLLLKQQAGALQDDLVRAISKGMTRYYRILLQMMKVYYDDDYWFQTKGGDGKYAFIMLNSGLIDSNIKIGVQVDSTLPLDKASQRSMAMDLWKAGNAIDYRTFMEDLGLDNPEVRTERYLRSKIDPIGYLKSVEGQQVNNDAETDIMLLIANKTPEERDVYDEDYLNYFNMYVTSNRFSKLRGPKSKDNPDADPEAAQRIIAYLMAVQHVAQETANLQGTFLDQAGMSTAPLTPPAPQKSIKIMGTLDPADSAQAAGLPPPQPPAAPQIPGQSPQVPGPPPQQGGLAGAIQAQPPMPPR